MRKGERIVKKLFSIILSLLFLFSCCGCAAQNGKRKFTKSFLDLFDTASSVSAYDTSEKSFEEHYRIFYKELETYARLYDIYNDYDGLANLKYVNENAALSPVKVDEKLMDLLLFGKEAYEISNGKVNICLGSVLSVWHSERENGINNPQSAKLPDMDLLKEKAEHADINNLVLNRENMTVYFKDPEMTVDVGAIAKGYAAERICEYIEQNGIWGSAVISLGGNVKTLGFKDGKSSPFVIGIDNPKNTENYLAKVNAYDGESVVTSGDYQRYYTVDGVDYCHIIDPETLMPAQRFSSVTVICGNSSYADMLSTALFNMSREQGAKLIENLDNTEALWADKNGNIYYSSGFENCTVK